MKVVLLFAASPYPLTMSRNAWVAGGALVGVSLDVIGVYLLFTRSYELALGAFACSAFWRLMIAVATSDDDNEHRWLVKVHKAIGMLFKTVFWPAFDVRDIARGAKRVKGIEGSVMLWACVGAISAEASVAMLHGEQWLLAGAWLAVYSIAGVASYFVTYIEWYYCLCTPDS